ncbi:putative integral membrane protein [Rosellinia necatrix]|uniref:Putative integral membrane protein n=1 Tax=Rosellinia necatrix TaxID=77044 RepID=A0A1W2TU44_ROSNE|nr:putative integral membrane protein [Rosellinia necatrix]
MEMAPPSLDPNDPGRGLLFIGLTWTFTILSLLVVAARFWVRIAVTNVLNVEDWLMLLASLLNLVGQSSLTVAYHYGLGKHDESLTFDQLVQIAKWIWIQFIPAILSSVTARISITILLVRIFGSKKALKWFLISTTTISGVACVAQIITAFVQVSPIEGLWNPLVGTRRFGPVVVEREGNVIGALFAFGDLTYVLFPIIVVWKLNMPFHRKLGLCLLLSVSLITMGISIAKAATAANTTATFYNSTLGLLFAGLEQTFVIMMGCVPPLSSLKKLKLPSVLRISTSVSRLFSSSRRGSRDDKEDASGLVRSSRGTDYELSVGV